MKFTLHRAMEDDKLFILRQMAARIQGVLSVPRLSDEAVNRLGHLAADFSNEVAKLSNERSRQEEERLEGVRP